MVPAHADDLPPPETINWADGLLLVYSITDRRSIAYLKRVGSLIADSDIPVYIIGNKNDMVCKLNNETGSVALDLAVETDLVGRAEEGAILARNFDCGFSEVAAAEMVAPVAVVFQELCRAVLAARRKSKHSLLERMLGTRTSNLRLYARGKSDSALPKD
ncbi:hypothetical protein NQ318_007353 [Aromia moschata]|uniref:small monomeric GTPase n=1 Tax=Aromia moschata TaxID=1265417 RepID=A0AAV8YZL7_9CUCU|nr:hypothetical protein NQ318_007353 [Aromia moschata]